MLCDSTFLLDRQTNVSPKLDELAELLGDLLGAGPHKVVVFSQWEQMLHQARKDRGEMPTEQINELWMNANRPMPV